MLSFALNIFTFILCFTMPETLNTAKDADKGVTAEVNGSLVLLFNQHKSVADRLFAWQKGAADSARFIWEDKSVALLVVMLSLSAFGKQSLFQILLIYLSKRFDLTMAQVRRLLYEGCPLYVR